MTTECIVVLVIPKAIIAQFRHFWGENRELVIIQIEVLPKSFFANGA